MYKSALLAFSLLSVSAPSFAQDVIESEQARFQIETVAEGLAFPWSLAFIDETTLLVSERDGFMRLIKNGVVQPRLANTPEAFVSRQAGMFDIALAPDFAESGMIYFSFAQGDADNNHTTLAKARLNIEANALEKVEIIYTAHPDKRRALHFGGRIAVMRDGTLLLSIGEGYIHMQEAQNPQVSFGKLIRINPDGSIPADNPFADGVNGAPEVYSYGHRNPQGLALHPDTGAIWMHEHGPRGGDEINIITPGTNYGWPLITYGIDYSGEIITEDRTGPGMVEPIWYWVPSIAPSGMTFYQGEAFPEWQGDLFVGALAGSKIERFELDGDRIISTEELLFDELGERIRDVRTGPDGYLYALIDDAEGRIIRLVPAGD
ncbi:PQQ-dependent sugar dehydrogenase [Woodsholea maritima]|uniref:PQQ-dependent sugar dehydrogenase n=1 Tax=Woodsholea maritima TaxID=240237 RepID=UPI000368615D|nr:PQQ-dependent sugar dehydrogenase [Woodsholea maritima]